MVYKQLIIARKDLQMSPGKLAAQVSHGAMAFLTRNIQATARKVYIDRDPDDPNIADPYAYVTEILMNKDMYETWINGIFAKVVCEARNRNHLLKSVEIAQSLGMKEGKDYFLIKDRCLTELTPEEIDEYGIGRTLTCIGFRPLPRDVMEKISKKYQLYK